jgi:hypothetical protein
MSAARYATRSGARTPRRRPATSEILAPAPPCPWPPEEFERLGGDLEQLAGHLRGLVSALREFDPAIDEAELSHEAAESQRWLYEVLLDAVDREQDRLQALAPMAAYGATAVAAPGEEA